MSAVEITKGKPSGSVNSREASISALIIGGIAVAGSLTLGSVYTLYSLEGAEELGITPAYDTANSAVVHHHISEFYRMAGRGTKLYLMVVAQTVLPSALLTDAGVIYGKKLVAEAKGEIRQLAIAFNPAAAYEETVTDGFNSDIRAAIAPAQEFAIWAYETERPLHVLLEGRAYSGNAATAINLTALTVGAGIALEADKVSVVIGQDWTYAEGLGAIGKKFADVGNVLGALSSINVNQNIGEVETMNITDATKGKFIAAGLSNHATIETSEASLADLETKGYIFPMTYTGISGYRWNNDHVCAPEIVDADGVMNESTIAYGRTMDEAVRRLRAALTPRIKSTQVVDRTTGKLTPGVVESFNALGDDVFEDMVGEGLISGGLTTTNADSDLLTGEKALEVDFQLQPTGTIQQIKGTINLKTSIAS